MWLKTEGGAQKRDDWSLGLFISTPQKRAKGLHKRAKRPLSRDKLSLVEDTEGWLERKGPGPLPWTCYCLSWGRKSLKKKLCLCSFPVLPSPPLLSLPLSLPTSPVVSLCRPRLAWLSPCSPVYLELFIPLPQPPECINYSSSTWPSSVFQRPDSWKPALWGKPVKNWVWLSG